MEVAQLKTDATPNPMPSLPPRLVSLAGSVGTVQHPGQPTRYHLQTGWAMSDLERAEAASLLSTLTSRLSRDAPFEGESAPDAKAALMTKMIRGFAGAADISEVSADSKMAVYADAVMDLPAWAIDVAIKRWARGSCPRDIEERPRFAFPPAPATLRALAMLETELPRRNVRMLENLLAAIPMSDALNPDWRAPKTFGVGPALRRM